MTTICPVNSQKVQIRQYLGNLCKSKSYKDIFTLLGTDGGLLDYLAPDAKVTSAEKNYHVYKHQLHRFKKCVVLKGSADKVLMYSSNTFDFIWLDFFGHMLDGDNFSATICAIKKLNPNGTIAITSKRGRRKNNLDEDFVLNSIGYKIVDKKMYTNNKSRMRLYILEKK